MSNASKILSKLSKAMAAVDQGSGDKSADLNITVRELVAWARQYNRAMVESGGGEVIEIYTNGVLSPGFKKQAFELYNTYYVANRQRRVTARNAKTGISLIDEDYHYLTVKTRDRKRDPTIPRVGRPANDWDDVDKDLAGDIQTAVREDF